MGLLTKIDGWTPVVDALVQEHGLVTAAVFGAVWRYCQMEDRVCRASLEVIGDRLGLDKGTVLRHIKKLCAAGYLRDLTPGRRNAPHLYADTGKAVISGSIQASPALESRTKRGQTVAEDNRTVAQNNSLDEKNTQTVAQNNATVAQNNATVAQNNATVVLKQLKKDSKRVFKKDSKRDSTKPMDQKSTVGKKRETAKTPPPAGVEAFREVTSRYPNKATWELISKQVNDSPTELERWRDTIRAYIACGWNPSNVKGMLAYYDRREIPGDDIKGRTNGKDSMERRTTDGRTHPDRGDLKRQDEFLQGIDVTRGGKPRL